MPSVTYTYVLGEVGTPPGASRRTYVGWTTDPVARLAAHNAGSGAKSTRGRTWELLYLERHKTRGQAMSREWTLKRDRAFRRALVS